MRSKTFLRLGIVAAFACLGAFVAWRRNVSGENAIALSVDAGDLSVGELWETEKYRLSLPVRNNGSQPITVRKYDTSCGCSHVSSPEMTIPAGETSHVFLDINLVDVGEQSSAVVRDFELALAASTDAGMDRIGWVVHGKVKRVLEVGETDISFEGARELIRGYSYAESVEIISHFPLASLEAVCSPSVAEVVLEDRGSEPQKFTLLVAPHANLEVGRHVGEISLVGVLPNGDRVLRTIAVRATVRPSIIAEPLAIRLDGAEADRSGNGVLVTLTSAIGEGFRIERMDSEATLGDLQQVSSNELREVHSFRLVPSQEVSGHSLLTFNTRSADDELEIVTVPVDVASQEKVHGEAK
jgi:hypothetical protein